MSDKFFEKDSTYLKSLILDILRNFEIIRKDLGLQLTVHYLESALASHWHYFHPFNFHNGIYCSKIKSSDAAWLYCTQCQSKVFKAVKSRGPFCGVCWAGVKEAIIPIRTIDNQIVAFISIGGYAANATEANAGLDRAAQLYGLDHTELQVAYSRLRSDMPSLEEIEQLITPLVHMITLLIAILDHSLVDHHQGVTREEKYGEVLHYLRKNFRQCINLQELADEFHYGYSSMCRLFTEQGGKSFSLTLNEIRIEAAKKYLELTEENVTVISGYVGYNDANYFSSLFSKMTGLTPKRYREEVRSKFKE